MKKEEFTKISQNFKIVKILSLGKRFHMRH